ncbi:MAG: type II toxin-antitoxin system HicB family antitoxin [Clostridiaceae bacterium]|jgi:predicted HicB family RNase H-like nuclease|nr:type II toxin-antitoxin system HicB family antitoxin [Clostridiaceae bacterium]
MSEYKIVLYPVETEEGIEWIARIPDVNNVGGSGATVEEAVKDVQNNLAFEIELLRQEGKEPPQKYSAPNYSGKISLRLPKSIHRQVAELSEQEGVSINSLITIAVSNFIGQKAKGQERKTGD